ncbi:MAG: tRNA dihydrouridine(20/20a) synthase DusA [Deltaproteobacteria bacterium]|nr:tRNA dihydrouridine(20/20a) synthase DusA [Deltaproteobacteria bacterium]
MSQLQPTTPPLSIAPMMDRTDRHFRYFFRQLSKRALLYTEMITTGALLHGDRESHLGFSPEEKPLALQLGGDDPKELATCARVARDWGYDEINLNVGCPSNRVQKGRFGACLMAEPQRVREAVEAMKAAVSLPVTVKHRIGIDDLDRYEDMARFVETVAAAGCQRFSVHARKAWLHGVSPKENRTIPPLRYEDVYRLKVEFPHLDIEINGGIRDLDQALGHLKKVDAVMIGRASYEDPYAWADSDRAIFSEPRLPSSRGEVVVAMLPYIEEGCSRGIPLGRMARHLLGLFAKQPGARAWKRHLSENVHLPGAGPEVVEAALARVPVEVVESKPVFRALA